jgi:hypothetical protein
MTFSPKNRFKEEEEEEEAAEEVGKNICCVDDHDMNYND